MVTYATEILRSLVAARLRTGSSQFLRIASTRTVSSSVFHDKRRSILGDRAEIHNIFRKTQLVGGYVAMFMSHQRLSTWSYIAFLKSGLFCYDGLSLNVICKHNSDLLIDESERVSLSSEQQCFRDIFEVKAASFINRIYKHWKLDKLWSWLAHECNDLSPWPIVTLRFLVLKLKVFFPCFCFTYWELWLEHTTLVLQLAWCFGEEGICVSSKVPRHTEGFQETLTEGARGRGLRGVVRGKMFCLATNVFWWHKCCCRAR